MMLARRGLFAGYEAGEIVKVFVALMKMVKILQILAFQNFRENIIKVIHHEEHGGHEEKISLFFNAFIIFMSFMVIKNHVSHENYGRTKTFPHFSFVPEYLHSLWNLVTR